jgi:PKD repeat protein
MRLVWTLLVVAMALGAVAGPGGLWGAGGPSVTLHAGTAPRNLTELVARANVSPVAGWAFDQFIPQHQKGAAYNFTANASGSAPPYAYAWDFGDGSAAFSGRNATHTYATSGLYVAELKVNDSVGRLATSTVNARAWVGSDADSGLVLATPALGAAPLEVGFRVRYTVGPNTSYAWTFGDGGSSNDSSPVHTFVQPGTYVVRLNLSAPEWGNHSTRLTVRAVGAEPLTALATALITQVCAVEGPEAFNLTLGSLVAGGAAPYSYSWDLGDGSAAVRRANCTDGYARSDFYTATLTVSDGHGSVATSAVNLEYVPHPCPPPAPLTITRLNYSIVEFCGQETWNRVNFSAALSGWPPYTHDWDFGDGSPRSSEGKPTHTYLASWMYAVTLMATDARGYMANHSVVLRILAPTCTQPSAFPWPGILSLECLVGAKAALAAYAVWRRQRRSAP